MKTGVYCEKITLYYIINSVLHAIHCPYSELLQLSSCCAATTEAFKQRPVKQWRPLEGSTFVLLPLKNSETAVSD